MSVSDKSEGLSLIETPAPPYYVVIFSSILSDDEEGYQETSQRMLELAHQQTGFLGVESAREAVGLTTSYWRDLASIRQWKQHVEHQLAQKEGQERWYKQYSIRIAKVERAYTYP